ncbi:MAG: hypothetical protein GJ676_02725 [Rhodobacteraceae bacterium]|nr:hypothetical protein [Paracoccaceae bacterium]
MRLKLAVMLLGVAQAATAQQSFLTASPIPDDAETRFCYYDGLAHSKGSVIAIQTGERLSQAVDGNAVNSGGAVREVEAQQLIECAVSDDGQFVWQQLVTRFR